jgi:hypothetical protein
VQENSPNSRHADEHEEYHAKHGVLGLRPTAACCPFVFFLVPGDESKNRARLGLASEQASYIGQERGFCAKPTAACCRVIYPKPPASHSSYVSAFLSQNQAETPGDGVLESRDLERILPAKCVRAQPRLSQAWVSTPRVIDFGMRLVE